MNERRKKLQETLKGFNKKQKSEVFKMGNEIEELPLIPSGIQAFDDFIGGGFKRGGHTIIWGNYSVGKTALVLTTIANAQKQGLIVCYVNSEKPIEPERFKFFGINLDEMVYIEAPENAEQALEAMRTLCKEKVIDLFIIDSTNGLCPKSVQEDSKGKERSLEKKNVASLALTLSNFYNIVNSYVFRSRASVIWIGQGRTQGIGTFFTRMGLSGGNAQEFYAYQIIYMRRGAGSDSPVAKFKDYFFDGDEKLRYKTTLEEIGFDAVLKMKKTNSSKSAREHTEMNMAYYYETGFYAPVEQEEIPIRILGSEEEKVKIEDILKEKDILPKFVVKQDGKILTENKDYVLSDNKTVTFETKEVIEKPKKRGRGRPKSK